MFKHLKVTIIVIFALVVSSCITTTKGHVKPKVNKQKAHDTHIQLGLAYLQRDNREGSRRHFEKALSFDKKSPPAYNGIALLHQLTGEDELAEQSFKKSLELDNLFTDARVNYGRFLYEKKRYEEARDKFEQASEDLSYPKRPLVLAYIGQAALELNNPVRAKSAFEHALNLDNKLSLAMIELGELYFADKEYAKSKQYLDRYIKLSGRTSKSLWLGIRIERIFGNRDKEASYALALKNLHPYSKEYLLYKKNAASSGR